MCWVAYRGAPLFAPAHFPCMHAPSPTPSYTLDCVCWQVLAKTFEVVTLLAQTCPGFCRRDAALAVSALADKSADPKLREVASATLTAIAEALGPKFACAQLWRHASLHKNPKVTEASLCWTAGTYADFGAAAMDAKALITMAKEGLSSPAPGVRTAAISLLGEMHCAVGPAVSGFLQDVKPALMAAIEAEFARRPHAGAPPPPRRAVRSALATGTGSAASGAAPAPRGGGSGDIVGARVAAVADFAGALPREDISGRITAAMLKDMGSASWKARQAALEAVDALVSEAGKRISPNLGPDLVPALKARLADSNKNLASLS